MSYFAIHEYLLGNKRPFQTVCCRALCDSRVLRLPASALESALRENSECLLSVVQLIMARLQRVVFIALHQHLGLTEELLRDTPRGGHGEEGNGLLSITPPLKSSSSREANLRHLEEAVAGFALELEVNDREFIRERVEIRALSHGSPLMTEAAHGDAALVFVLSGALELSRTATDDEEDKSGEQRVLYTAREVIVNFLLA